MALERFQCFEPEQEDDGVAALQEVLGRSGPAGSGAKVVDEPE